VSSGILSSVQLAQALAAQYEVPYVELPPLPQAVLDLVPLELQRQHRFVPLTSDGTELSIAMADLANLEVVASLERQWTKVHVSVASGDEIDALHATLSGLIPAPGQAPPAASSGGSPAIDELFGMLELEPELPPGVSSVNPSQAMPIASGGHAAPVPGDVTPRSPSSLPAVAPAVPVSPRVTYTTPGASPSPAPLVDALFSDLNLDSVPAGIPAKGPIAPPQASPESREVSGQVLSGVVEGTGPLLDMLSREGTGPVVDTPFFNNELPEPLVPTMSDEPFVSSRAPVTMPEPAVAGPPPAEDLPDWLRESAAPAAERPPPAAASAAVQAGATTAAPLPPQPWTGALEHLMPSKLVVGLTRALLAKGLVTEAEILAALGPKK
jgi:hypothetical protein